MTGYVVRVLLALSLYFQSTLPLAPAPPATVYRTGLVAWRAADGGFTGWQRDGVRLTAGGGLELDPATARAGEDPYAPASYHGRNYYNGGRYVLGEAISPATQAGTGFSQLIPSWNAQAPDGTWLEVALRARVGAEWTGWYVIAVWAAAGTQVARHSLDEQASAEGYVNVDTLTLREERGLANALQMRLRLFATDPALSPTVDRAAVAWSTAPKTPSVTPAGDPSLWDHVLPVPSCSQMLYPDGGPVWCSPTSASMILAYWRGDGAPCEPGVRAAVEGVYDWLYEGHGNWPFNTAYAATQGFEAYVVRFTSFAEAEPWIAAGVPIAITFAWGPGELDGAALPYSDGHLAVLAGFDAQGNPVVNDPAAASDAAVPRVYPRRQLERLWLRDSGGAGYVIYPPGWSVPGIP